MNEEREKERERIVTTQSTTKQYYSSGQKTEVTGGINIYSCTFNTRARFSQENKGLTLNLICSTVSEKEEVASEWEESPDGLVQSFDHLLTFHRHGGLKAEQVFRSLLGPRALHVLASTGFVYLLKLNYSFKHCLHCSRLQTAFRLILLPDAENIIEL